MDKTFTTLYGQEVWSLSRCVNCSCY